MEYIHTSLLNSDIEGKGITSHIPPSCDRASFGILHYSNGVPIQIFILGHHLPIATTGLGDSVREEAGKYYFIILAVDFFPIKHPLISIHLCLQIIHSSFYLNTSLVDRLEPRSSLNKLRMVVQALAMPPSFSSAPCCPSGEEVVREIANAGTTNS